LDKNLSLQKKINSGVAIMHPDIIEQIKFYNSLIDGSIS